jgi:hypothetical protein
MFKIFYAKVIDPSIMEVLRLEGPNMIKYAKKFVLRQFSFKNSFFSTLTFKKILKTYLYMLHLESLITSLLIYYKLNINDVSI